jgi:ribosome recycling factor
MSEDLNSRMKKALESLEKEFQSIRTGRANPGMLDKVHADYYGSSSQIKNMANISTLDGRTLEIKPFDKGLLKAIEKAILDSNLGLTPTNDGSRLLIMVPELTKERRVQLAKQVKEESEKAKVAVRNIRRDEMDRIKKQTEGSEDEKKRNQDEVEKITSDFIKKIDTATELKEKDILSLN